MRLAIAVLTILVSVFTLSFASSFVAYGPENFVRDANSPDLITRTFSANPNTTYTLRINNGGLVDGQYEMVSSSIFSLNGVQIAGPSEFNQNVNVVEKPVTLQANNTLSIEVRGKPGGGLTLQIIGVDDDDPVLTLSQSPTPNAAGWTNFDTTVFFSCSDALSGIASCPPPFDNRKRRRHSGFRNRRRQSWKHNKRLADCKHR